MLYLILSIISVVGFVMGFIIYDIYELFISNKHALRMEELDESIKQINKRINVLKEFQAK